MLDAWMTMMRAATPQPACGPARLSWAWRALWALAVDPGRNPWLAAGIAFGPFGAAWRWQHGAEEGA
jgi:hypothetical protein